MSENKHTVQTYMDAFARTDHAEILACLTDDVEWLVPGAFHAVGKAALERGHQRKYPMVGDEQVLRHQGVGARSAHAGDEPGIFDLNL